jgi:hypothetical protein
MMFGRNLKRREMIRGLVDVFGGHCIWFGWLDKKIESWIFLDFFAKTKNFRSPIFFSSLRTPAEQPPNASSNNLGSIAKDRLLPNIKGSQGRMNLKKTNKIFSQTKTFSFPLEESNSWLPTFLLEISIFDDFQVITGSKAVPQCKTSPRLHIGEEVVYLTNKSSPSIPFPQCPFPLFKFEHDTASRRSFLKRRYQLPSSEEKSRTSFSTARFFALTGGGECVRFLQRRQARRRLCWATGGWIGSLAKCGQSGDVPFYEFFSAFSFCLGREALIGLKVASALDKPIKFVFLERNPLSRGKLKRISYFFPISFCYSGRFFKRVVSAW